LGPPIRSGNPSAARRSAAKTSRPARRYDHRTKATELSDERMPSVLSLEIPYVDPVSAFAAFAGMPGAVFLDSAQKGERQGRYSFIAADPFLILTSKDGRISAGDQTFTGDPFAAVAKLLARFPLDRSPGLPPFQGGAAGCLGYDLCHHLERLPLPERDDMQFPDLALGFYDTIAAFDLLAERAWVLSSGYPETSPEARLTRRRIRLEEFSGRLGRATPLNPMPVTSGEVVIRSNFTRPAYEAAVRRVIDYILAGDIFQANLAQRFSAELPENLSTFDLYRRLREHNAAPFAAYLDFGDVVVASASPERFLKLEDGLVETRPIKGTRPRGATPENDAANARELLASEKDRAENVMIVDLLRNDLSRVCRDHSVLTPEICTLESFATVHHLVSTATGRLKPDMGPVDLLRATFPGGSITGAPKIRAMEIIAELEPTRRGPYCGAIGYIGFDGMMDLNIAIRTYAIEGRTVTFQAGGGIVADSDPAAEYEETIAKARALIGALRGLP
jgi:para-aminobenzoate synthetase component 1